ncbi:uncharacterized protein LOC120172827 [Hibiscus syriacus]|uniref:uncharacterized protein LOC120172827 n=1 Tax=Hibiscus syriacus TaxID=106335 RepID=UPI001921E229|nr:uncharacterized protein LOC120172827 [Hibiscus syriacus]
MLKIDAYNLRRERAVTRKKGIALAQQHKCSFLECSAKTRANVHQCFKIHFEDFGGPFSIGERVDGSQEADFAAETSTQSTRKQWLLLSMKTTTTLDEYRIRNNVTLGDEVPQQAFIVARSLCRKSIVIPSFVIF